MSWDTIRAEEYCESVRDGTHDTPKPVSNGYKLVTGKHIQNGQIDPTDAYFISENDYRKINERSKVEKWDVLMSMIGNGLGRSAVVKKEPDYAIKNIALFKVGDEKKAKWLHYYLSSPQGQGFIYNSLQGSGQPFISLSFIRDFPIPTPPLPYLNKAVSILEIYDDLIENNQKQIKLLEEAAQRLYKEWFVDLRFPNYENTPVVDGVPEGWEKCLLSDVADVNKLNLPKSNEYDSIDYIDLSSVKKGHILEKTRYKIKEAPGRAKKLAIDGDIIWGMVRPNLCSYALVMHPNERDVFSTGFAVISSKKVPFSYLYCLATEESFIGYLVNCTNGAAYPAVKPIHFEEAKILKPVDEILNQFHSIAEPIYRKIEALDKMVISLAEARDRLLPKLMSGELEV